jgi:heme-degrading monooxygenase HmoA
MYALLTTFTLGVGMRSKAEELADRFARLLKNMKGFKNLLCLGDYNVGEYVALSIWQSRDDAEAAASVAGPQLQQALTGIVKGPVTRRCFEVYEPKQ